MYWAQYVLMDRALRGGGMRSTECPSSLECVLCVVFCGSTLYLCLVSSGNNLRILPIRFEEKSVRTDGYTVIPSVRHDVCLCVRHVTKLLLHGLSEKIETLVNDRTGGEDCAAHFKILIGPL